MRYEGKGIEVTEVQTLQRHPQITLKLVFADRRAVTYHLLVQCIMVTWIF